MKNESLINNDTYKNFVIRQPSSSHLPIADTIEDIRKYKILYGSWIFLFLILGVVYIKSSQSEYTATAAVILNPSRQVAGSSTGSESGSSLTLDSAQTESQIQVLKSERVLSNVFQTLDLESAAEFKPKSRTNLLSLLGASTELPKTIEVSELTKRHAFQAFVARVNVKRVSQSYVIEVSYQAFSPEESARVVNAICMQYIKGQIELKAASIQRGSEFLQGRIASIKSQLAAATEGVRNGKVPETPFPDADSQVISSATPPLGRSSPKSGIIVALCLTFSIFSGLIVLIFKNSLDKTVKSPSQLKDWVNIDVIANIPILKRSAYPRHIVNSMDKGSVPFQTDKHTEKFFQTLLTSLLISSPIQEKLRIGITSWSPGEGKTTVANKLVGAFVRNARKITLVRIAKSRVSDPVTDPNASSYMKDPGSSKQNHQVDAFYPNEYISVQTITFYSTPTKEELYNFMASLPPDADIIFDLSAIRDHPDVLVFSEVISCYILVISAGRTTYEEAESAWRAIKSSNARSISAVINKLK
ncbi:Wzz/FepE/Etk N-terminal domain-containing protein [Methylobacterium pseudosasicola]|uniref:Chain length determinant protein n=1 Tax=Methylobacterium pseudosasicola TaxID=582667 RepID=A0A1I4V4K9_9HYPH|nr:Wzz/FepE/Etk N-terminal domain-containing protein [Methylobacterium pseudosasicola]SFM96139.1 Chain length determinant protein [Methylobacterium pseudosasicola]